jgi:iron(III) transport system substrate-binding protein
VARHPTPQFCAAGLLTCRAMRLASAVGPETHRATCFLICCAAGLLTRRVKVALLVIPFFLAALGGCVQSEPSPSAETVTVYTSLDQVYSEPILNDFQKRTGIRVQAVYDAEAAKTTGLTNRLIARRERPDCDVWWNNEPVQTARLAGMGLLAKYESPASARIPPAFRDGQSRWTGFAARARIIIYNTKLVPSDRRPAGLQDFAAPAWRGKATIARPFFGTTLTHMCILYDTWGPERLKAFLLAMRANDVALCAGNGPVRDLVAAGEYAFGLTDTDDAYSAMQEGKPVAVVLPDRAAGAVILPNTVALIAGCPHAEAGRKLIDYLLSAEVERRLAEGPSAQIPLGTDLADVRTPWDDLRRANTQC